MIVRNILFEIFLVWCVVERHVVLGNTETATPQPGYTFSVFARDFLNTQKTKICLIARLNASLQLTYSAPGAAANSTLTLPSTASTEGSVCDYEFTSRLSLTFSGINLTLFFTRDTVVSPSTQNQYCLRCDVGNWKLSNISLLVNDVSTAFHSAHFPPTRLSGWSSSISARAHALLSGVSVQRSYRCDDPLLSTLNVTVAENATSHHSSPTDPWGLEVVFHHFAVEPFLVNTPNDGSAPVFKDPYLCKDVQVFHILVILTPLVYFFFFVLIYRIRERYGCPPRCSSKGLVRLKTTDHDEKKPLSSSSIQPSSTKPSLAEPRRSTSVTITRTPPTNKL